MTTKIIWNRVNERRELIRLIYRAICEKQNIDNLMSMLKQKIPCLYGVDFEKRAFVFRSSDEGLVAVYVKEQGDDFVLALGTEIVLD